MVLNLVLLLADKINLLFIRLSYWPPIWTHSKKEFVKRIWIITYIDAFSFCMYMHSQNKIIHIKSKIKNLTKAAQTPSSRTSIAVWHNPDFSISIWLLYIVFIHLVLILLCFSYGNNVKNKQLERRCVHWIRNRND